MLYQVFYCFCFMAMMVSVYQCWSGVRYLLQGPVSDTDKDGGQRVWLAQQQPDKQVPLQNTVGGMPVATWEHYTRNGWEPNL